MQPMAHSQYSFVVSTGHSQLLTAAYVITIHELRELPFSFFSTVLTPVHKKCNAWPSSQASIKEE